VKWSTAAKFGVSARWKELNDVTTDRDIEDRCSCTVFGRGIGGHARYMEYSRELVQEN